MSADTVVSEVEKLQISEKMVPTRDISGRRLWKVKSASDLIEQANEIQGMPIENRCFAISESVKPEQLDEIAKLCEIDTLSFGLDTYSDGSEMEWQKGRDDIGFCQLLRKVKRFDMYTIWSKFCGFLKFATGLQVEDVGDGPIEGSFPNITHLTVVNLQMAKPKYLLLIKKCFPNLQELSYYNYTACDASWSIPDEFAVRLTNRKLAAFGELIDVKFVPFN